LSDEQQLEALQQRLGERVEELRPYLDKVPLDEMGRRVTANPLMLSMVASVFDIRGGMGMPSKITDLYKLASDQMLSRGGVTSEEVRQLLQAVFFEAHVAQRRVIDDRQLDEAALGLEQPETLAAIRARAVEKAPLPSFSGNFEVGHFVEVAEAEHRSKRGVISEYVYRLNMYRVTFADGSSLDLEAKGIRSSGLDETAFVVHAMAHETTTKEVRVACDRLTMPMRDALSEVRRRVKHDKLPLLSLLQAEPLKLQSSHLSFQEYFAACALCSWPS
jgi:hypothetical protein